MTENNLMQLEEKNSKLDSFTKDLMHLMDRVTDSLSVEVLQDSRPPHLKVGKIRNIKMLVDETMKTNVLDYITEMLRDSEVVDKWKLLTKLEESSNAEEKAWRPPGNVDDHTRPYRVDMYLKELREIQQFAEVTKLSISPLMKQLEELTVTTSQSLDNVDVIERCYNEYIEESSEEKKYIEEVFSQLNLQADFISELEKTVQEKLNHNEVS